MRIVMIRLCAAAAIIIAGLIGCSNDVLPESPWHGIQSVDTEGNVGSDVSLYANDSKLWISYYDTTNGDLKFARSEDGGATWPESCIEVVDSAGDVGQYADMDKGYIAYYDSINADLKFAKGEFDFNDCWTWTRKTVDNAGDVGLLPSIKTYGSYVYISYYDTTNGDLKFARSEDGGATWPAENIQTVNSTGLASSLEVDGDGRVLIAYLDSISHNLKFVSGPGADSPIDVETTVTIDSASYVGNGVDFAVDLSDDSLYVAHYDSSNGNLKLAKSTDHGATWTSGTIDSTGDVGFMPSIAAANGTVYISYYDITNASLKIAKSTDGGATGDIQTVATGNVGSCSAVAFQDSTVCIAFLDSANRDLMFAKSIDGGTTW